MIFFERIKHRKSIIKDEYIKNKIHLKYIHTPSGEKILSFTVELKHKPTGLSSLAVSFDSRADAERKALNDLNYKYKLFLEENPEYYHKL